MSDTHSLFRQIRLRSATALVVANMIGAGIFTTTGFQAADLGHPVYIFVLWICGGVLALFGALCYAELGALMPQAGGEYVYLRRTYGPALGFMSAFVSLIAGFSAPIASATKALVRYLAYFFPVLGEELVLGLGLSLNDLIAIAIVWFLISVHIGGVRSGLGFNDAVTLFKVAGILIILLGAAAVGNGNLSNLTRVSDSFYELSRTETLTALGTSFIFVMFCYSGWNAAAYVAGEMKDPQRNLPRALLMGTGIVLVLYLGLNAVYLYGANVDELAGKVEVGLVASRALFGAAGVTLVNVVLSVSLLAAVSAMTVAGPRVYYALGIDFHQFSFLARTRSNGAPVTALCLQGIITSAIILAGRVDQIQQYTGFTLVLFSSLAVSCVIVLRLRDPHLERPFRAWGYPFTPVLFLSVSVWMMYWAFQGRPLESTLALMTVVAGGAVFSMTRRRQGRENSDFDGCGTRLND